MVKAGDKVKIIATRQELFDVGMCSEGSLSMSGTIQHVYAVDVHPSIENEVMVYLRNRKDGTLWVLGKHVEVQTTENN